MEALRQDSWPMRSTWARCRSARRNVSTARRLATVISQAPGLAGMPSRGQDSRAATSASWARSSASCEVAGHPGQPGTTRADSSCQTATTASWVVVTDTHGAGGPSSGSPMRRTSAEPSQPGQWSRWTCIIRRAPSTASSWERTSSTAYPPTTSLASANGPSTRDSAPARIVSSRRVGHRHQPAGVDHQAAGERLGHRGVHRLHQLRRGRADVGPHRQHHHVAHLGLLLGLVCRLDRAHCLSSLGRVALRHPAATNPGWAAWTPSPPPGRWPSRLGLDASGAVVLRELRTAVVHLRPSPVVARVAPAAEEDVVRRQVAVTAYLAGQGAPVAAPWTRPRSACCRRVGGHVVGVRRPRRLRRPLDGFAAGPRAARRARGSARGFDPGGLPVFPRLDEVRRILATLDPSPADARDLAEMLDRAVVAAERIDAPVQVVHGDAWLGNVLRTPGRTTLERLRADLRRPARAGPDVQRNLRAGPWPESARTTHSWRGTATTMLVSASGWPRWS